MQSMQRRGLLSSSPHFLSGLSRPLSCPRGGHGQVLILFALMLTVLISMLAMVFDVGYGLVQRRTMQNFADATAMAATQAIGNNSSYTPVYDSTIYLTLQDIVNAAGVPYNNISIGSSAGSTIGTVYVVDQYVDSNGVPVSPPTYVLGATPPIPSGAAGVKSTVTITYQTSFASLIGIPTVTVSGATTAVGKHVIPAGFNGLEPFAARWDPGYGGSTAAAYYTASNGSVGCTPASVLECYHHNTGSQPMLYGATGLYNWAFNHTTTFDLYGNAWLGDNTGPGPLDPDWNSTSSSFKGFTDNSLDPNGCVTGGSNFVSGQGNALGFAPVPAWPGVYIFPLIDYANQNGHNIQARVYGAAPLYIADPSALPLTGVLVPTSSFQANTACGSTQIDPTGTSPFISAFIIG